jgi:hypothetical protein
MQFEKRKSVLQEQKEKNKFTDNTLESAAIAYKRNLYFLKNMIHSSEKSLTTIILLNTLFFLSAFFLNYLNPSFFTKETILLTLNNFNILLPLLILIPFLILSFEIIYKNKDNFSSYVLIGKLVGTSTMLTIIPFVSVIATSLLRHYLI